MTTTSLSKWRMKQEEEEAERNNMMESIRQQIVKRGGGSIAALERRFYNADTNNDQKISLKDELPKLLSDLKINFNAQQVERLGQLLDLDHDGTIDFDEFLYYIAPPLNPLRTEYVNRIFDKLDKSRSGKISKEELAKAQNSDARYNPLCKLCDKRGDGVIDRQELIDFYREISPSIESDGEFITMLQNSWGF